MKTTFIGAHQWEITKRGGYDYLCSCGEKGHIASYNMVFVMECFARHAHEALQEAAVALLGQHLNYVTTDVLSLWVNSERAAGENDKANLLQLIVNHREDNG